MNASHSKRSSNRRRTIDESDRGQDVIFRIDPLKYHVDVPTLVIHGNEHSALAQPSDRLMKSAFPQGGKMLIVRIDLRAYLGYANTLARFLRQNLRHES